MTKRRVVQVVAGALILVGLRALGGCGGDDECLNDADCGECTPPSCEAFPQPPGAGGLRGFAGSGGKSSGSSAGGRSSVGGATGTGGSATGGNTARAAAMDPAGAAGWGAAPSDGGASGDAAAGDAAR